MVEKNELNISDHLFHFVFLVAARGQRKQPNKLKCTT